MKQTVLVAIIAVLAIGTAVAWRFMGTSGSPEPGSYQMPPSPSRPVSGSPTSGTNPTITKSTGDATVDQELNQMEKELNADQVDNSEPLVDQSL